MTEIEIEISSIKNEADNFHIKTQIPISFGELYWSLDDCFTGCCGLFEIIRISDVLIKIKFGIGSYDFWYNRDKVIKAIKNNLNNERSEINIECVGETYNNYF